MAANRKEELNKKMFSSTGGGGLEKPSLGQMGADGVQKKPLTKTHQEESDYSEEDWDDGDD